MARILILDVLHKTKFKTYSDFSGYTISGGLTIFYTSAVLLLFMIVMIIFGCSDDAEETSTCSSEE